MDIERDLRDRLDSATQHLGFDDFDVTKDLGRGRRRMRRNHFAAAGSGMLVAAVIGAGWMLVGGPDGGTTSGPPAQFTASQEGDAATPSPSAASSTVPSDKASHPGNKAGEPTLQGVTGPSLKSTRQFRYGLYDIVADHLDASKKYLNYDTNNLQSIGGGQDSQRSLGIKLGWSVPGQAGEGMVQISVSNITGPDADPCGLYSGTTCKPVDLPGGGSAQLGQAADGTFEVAFRQPDGEKVGVIVDPLFGNNSTVAVDDMAISKQDVYALVQDTRISLPTPTS